MRERNPISCQGNFIQRELPARWGPGPSIEFQDVSRLWEDLCHSLQDPVTMAFGLLWVQSRAWFTCDPRRQAGEGAQPADPGPGPGLLATSAWKTCLPRQLLPLPW